MCHHNYFLTISMSVHLYLAAIFKMLDSKLFLFLFKLISIEIELLIFDFFRETTTFVVRRLWQPNPRSIHPACGARSGVACGLFEVSGVSPISGRELYVFRAWWQNVLQTRLCQVNGNNLCHCIRLGLGLGLRLGCCPPFLECSASFIRRAAIMNE